MNKEPSRREVLNSLGKASVVTTASVFAGCAGSNDAETETRRTVKTAPTAESEPTSSDRTTPSPESTASETATLCEEVFGEWSTPGGANTEMPECVNVDLDVVVIGRPETPTPTDSTSTPYKFVREIHVTVDLPGADGIQLNVCVESGCDETASVSESIDLPSEETRREYSFGPFGYSCIENADIWVEECRRA